MSTELQKGGLRALEETWDDLLITHFPVKSYRLLFFWGVSVAPGGVKLRLRRSQEVIGSPELQNGGLRALEEAWDDLLIDAFSC